MSKQDSQRIQSCILKVNIDCNGCAQKVKKLLQKIHGVSSVNIDAEQGKVLVTGAVDPAILIKKLNKSGKHAELWGGAVDLHNQNYPINNSKGGSKNNKSQNQKGHKGGDIKGAQNLKVIPTKQNKSVKFNLPHEKSDASDDGYDEFHDDFDDYDEDEEAGHGHGVGPFGPAGKMNGPVMKGSGGGGGKKGSVIDPTMLIKGKGGNQYFVGGDQRDSKSTSVRSIGRFLGFGKKSKKGGAAADTYNNKDNHNYNYKGIKEDKECDGKLEGHGHNDESNNGNGKNGKYAKGNNGNGNVGQMGPMETEGLKVMDGGGYGPHQAMQMQPPQYNQQQQQIMAMMMNQQQQQQAYMNNNMYPPEAMMYGRPQYPPMNYMPPPPMPSHPRADPITHTFSDENVDSCSIM